MTTMPVPAPPPLHFRLAQVDAALTRYATQLRSARLELDEARATVITAAVNRLLDTRLTLTTEEKR